MPGNNRKRDHRDEPTYWFAILEIAREKRNPEQEAEATRQLKRLGVAVAYLSAREAAR